MGSPAVHRQGRLQYTKLIAQLGRDLSRRVDGGGPSGQNVEMRVCGSIDGRFVGYFVVLDGKGARRPEDNVEAEESDKAPGGRYLAQHAEVATASFREHDSADGSR